MATAHEDLLTLLRDQRAELTARLAAADAGARELASARDATTGDDEHDPEGSTLSWDLATQQSTADATRRHLEEIDAALARIECGWDGACAGCGEPIPRARLLARPSAVHCVECAAAERSGRPRR